MSKILNYIIVIMFVLVPVVKGVAWNVDRPWCYSEHADIHLNPTSFTTGDPVDFPNYYTVVDQVLMAANYWNDSGTEFYFRRKSDTTSTKANGAISMVSANHFEGDAIALTHTEYTWCGYIGIVSYYIIFSEGVNWRTHYNDTGVSFYTVAAHEFGHALGMLHNFDEYNEILMSYGISRGYKPGNNIQMLTEDDAFGATHLYGRNEQKLRFVTARIDPDYGPVDFSDEQDETGSLHETYAQPFIAPNHGPDPFDFAVAWTHADDRRVAMELIKMDSYSTHHIYEGPFTFIGATSWQGPSIAVNNEGRIGIAYRYEKENPNINDPVELKRNSMIRLIISDPSRNIWYNVEPSTCASNHVCRTMNTPVISYSPSTHRWLIAFTEAPESDDVIGYMHSVSILISDDNTGLSWSRPPFRTGYHSSFVAPGFDCNDPNGYAHCLLAYANWDRSDGWMGRIYQVGIVIGGNNPSGLYELYGSHFEWGKSGFAHINVAGNYWGWIMNRIDSPAVYYDDLTWSWKNWANGIEGLWDRDGHNSKMMAQQGHSVACKWIEKEVRCVFVWEKE